MAGKKCPSCEKLTLFTVGNKSTCDCGFEMTVPPNDGKGGKGIQCPNCEKNTLFENGKKVSVGIVVQYVNFPKNEM